MFRLHPTESDKLESIVYGLIFEVYCDQQNKDLLRHFKEVELLPEKDKSIAKKLKDAFITKKKIQQLTG